MALKDAPNTFTAKNVFTYEVSVPTAVRPNSPYQKKQLDAALNLKGDKIVVPENVMTEVDITIGGEKGSAFYGQ